MTRIKKNKTSDFLENILAPKREFFTKLKFIVAVLQGTAAVLAITLVLSIYMSIIYFSHIKKINTVVAPYQSSLIFDKVSYQVDKNFYRPDEVINLNIVNNTDESIYLAPCQYFNKFEKKILNEWQAVSFVACDRNEFLTDFSAAEIEKISKKAEESIAAEKLGKGIWRGVSLIYFGCQKAQTIRCESSQEIYTNEFTIGDLEITASAEPQF